MGDGLDFSVWYNGMIIAYVKAPTKRKAINLARKIYGNEVTITATNRE